MEIEIHRSTTSRIDPILKASRAKAREEKKRRTQAVSERTIHSVQRDTPLASYCRRAGVSRRMEGRREGGGIR